MKTQPARFVSRVFVVCAVSVGSVAGAQPLPTGSDRATDQVEALEQQLKVEFLAAGNATRERLDQEAAGNHVAAQRAARVAEAHRHRFLELKRDIARLTTPIAPSVAAARDPFAPDPSFVAFAAHAGENRALTIAAAEEGESSSGPTTRPAWDLYRPHTASGPSVATRGDRADSTPLLVKTQGDAERAWGMYEHAAPSRGTGETRSNFEDTSASSAAPEARAPPSHPYFVYRDPQGPPTSR
jgi:hypothetical protein